MNKMSYLYLALAGFISVNCGDSKESASQNDRSAEILACQKQLDAILENLPPETAAPNIDCTQDDAMKDLEDQGFATVPVATCLGSLADLQEVEDAYANTTEFDCTREGTYENIENLIAQLGGFRLGKPFITSFYVSSVSQDYVIDWNDQSNGETKWEIIVKGIGSCAAYVQSDYSVSNAQITGASSTGRGARQFVIDRMGAENSGCKVRVSIRAVNEGNEYVSDYAVLEATVP